MDGLQRDTLELLQLTAKQAAGAVNKCVIVERLPGERPGTYGVITADGELLVKRAEPPPRQSRLTSLGAIEDYLKLISEHELSKQPAIYYNAELITILLDESDESRRDESCVIELERSPECAVVDGLAASEQWIDQRALIRLLRVKLAGCLGESGDELIRLLRTIEFGEASQGRGNLQHGKESLGREVEAEIRASAGELPEKIVLQLRVFSDPVLRDCLQPVWCALDIKPREGTFNLCPLPGELQLAEGRTLDVIGNLLRDAAGTIPVIAGTP
jgi:hypothetical protein